MADLSITLRLAAEIMYDAERSDYQRFQAICALLEQVYEDGYDQAAQEITLKIQSCIGGDTRTVEDARVKGAWTDAGNVALNHIGKLSRK